jgi:hypothetical protein
MLQSCQINMDHGNKKWKFSSWPGLTEHAVEKHLSKSTSASKGHLNQQRQNARATKIKEAQVLVPETDIDYGIKTNELHLS